MFVELGGGRRYCFRVLSYGYFVFNTDKVELGV